MKRAVFCSLFFLLFISALGQGIKFEEKLSWSEIRAKAKTENKYIFIDCFATWCTPCRWMNINIFSSKEVGDYFNKNFINVAVQMDVTSNDSQEIKKWYADAKSISLANNIEAYPTYLFFNSDGIIVHKITGLVQTSKEFINRAAESQNVLTQNSIDNNNWKYHISDSTYLLNTIKNAISNHNNTLAYDVSAYYLESLNNPLTIDNIKLFSNYIKKSSDKTFLFFVKNSAAIGKIVGYSQYAPFTISQQIAHEEIDPVFFYAGDRQIYLSKIGLKIKKKYPTINLELKPFLEYYFNNQVLREIKSAIKAEDLKYGSVNLPLTAKKFKSRFPDCKVIDSLILSYRPDYYSAKNQPEACAAASIQYLNAFGYQLTGPNINNQLWYNIFLKTSNIHIISKALRWAKFNANLHKDDSGYLDSYANLAYKAGEINLAISLESKALEMAALSKNDNNRSAENFNEFTSTLAKMKSGQKTWE